MSEEKKEKKRDQGLGTTYYSGFIVDDSNVKRNPFLLDLQPLLRDPKKKEEEYKNGKKSRKKNPNGAPKYIFAALHPACAFAEIWFMAPRSALTLLPFDETLFVQRGLSNGWRDSPLVLNSELSRRWSLPGFSALVSRALVSGSEG